jgi:transcriptional regulator with XRE-family HTH domain
MASGLSRAQIARMVGCTRMHVWRIQQRKMKTDSKLSKQIAYALRRFDLDEQARSALQAEVMGEIERIVQKDPVRLKLVLQMIRLAQQI